MTVFVFHQDQQGYHYELQSVLPSCNLKNCHQNCRVANTVSSLPGFILKAYLFSVGDLGTDNLTLIRKDAATSMASSDLTLEVSWRPQFTIYNRSQVTNYQKELDHTRRILTENDVIQIVVFLFDEKKSLKKKKEMWYVCCSTRKNIFLLYTISDGLHFCTPDLRSIVNLSLRRGQSENFKRGDMFWNSVHECFKIYF